MFINNLEYETEPEANHGKKRGCYELAITRAKTTQVKLLNRWGAKSISISRPKEKINSEVKWSRRQPGVFYVKDEQVSTPEQIHSFKCRN